MKKLVILSMLLLLVTVCAFANTARSYYQYVTDGTSQAHLLTLVTSTAASYTAPNYTISAYVVGRESEVLQTGVTPVGSLRLSRQTATQVTCYVQLSTFTTQWAANDVVHVTVTYTLAGPHNGETASWNFTIPTGTSPINDTNTKTIPPTAESTGYDVQVNSNIAGMIYDGGISTGFRAPHLFAGLVAASSHTFTVETVPTMVTPGPQTATAAATLTFTYTNIAGTTGGGFAAPTVAGPISITTGGMTVTGNATAPGLIVVTVNTLAGKAAYEGYTNVWPFVPTVWVEDTSTIVGANLIFNYPSVLPTYVAVHWGSNFYPAAAPNPGYAFNGGAVHGGFALGMAPFTAASYPVGVGPLTLGPIPAYSKKGPGTLEVILNLLPSNDLPVVLSSFTALPTAQMFVNLQWTTESETNNLGFNVFRSNDTNVANASQVNLGIINGTNTSTTHNYNFADMSVNPETTYYYWLQMIDFDGQVHFSNFVTVTTSGVTPPPTTPDATVLRSAYPNPFNSNTNIEMDVKTGETATLTIYNVLGQEVKTYVRQAGSHKITWNRTDDNGSVVGSGIYFYKLSSPSQNITKKMVIVK
jgi:hypothetical protein